MINRLSAPTGLQEKTWPKTLVLFLAFVCSLATFLGGLLYFHAKESMNHNLEVILHEQQIHINLVEILFQQELNNLATNFLAFASTPGILQILTTPYDQTNRQTVNANLTNFLPKTEEYIQLQAFDNYDQELISIEKKGKQVAIKPSGKYTITAANDLLERRHLQGPDQATISPLNVARNTKGEIKRPFRPIFQIGAPIFNRQQQKTGSIILTYKGQPLIDLFHQTMVQPPDHDAYHPQSHPQILNENGYWLLTADKKNEWGFIRDSQRRFDHRFPEIWQLMRKQGHGQIKTADGLFTFVTIALASGKTSNGADDKGPASSINTNSSQPQPPVLILLNQISTDELSRLNNPVRKGHFFLFLVIMLLALPLLLWLSQLLITRRVDKKELQVQEQRFRLLYDKAPLPYMSLDHDGHVITVNQTWLTVMGYNSQAVIGRWFGDFVAAPSLAHFLVSFALFAEKGEMESCEVELVRQNGSTLLASFHGELLTNDQDTFFQTHCMFTDITELRVEKQRTAHLHILLQTLIEIHRLIDQNRDKHELMQKCCEIMITNRGYSSAWIILLDKSEKIEITAESGLLHNLNQLELQINQGNPPPCILECRNYQGPVVIDTPLQFCGDCPTANKYPRKGVMCAPLPYGSTVYGYIHVSLPLDFIQDQEEKNIFSEISRDIGYALFNLEQQAIKNKMENSLRVSEERLRCITDFAHDAILMMDNKGAISFWNPAGERIFGYSAKEALGMNLHELLVPSRYHADQQAAFAAFLRSGQGKVIGQTIEVSALHKNGHEIPVTLSLSAVFQDGQWQAVGILRDTTERKMMEEQLLQAEKMTTIAGLTAGIAHEINTPLSAILQSIQVIQQSLSPELARNQELAGSYGLDLHKIQDFFAKNDINFFMDGIRDSAIKSGKIISTLLQFSRPQQGEAAWEHPALLLDKAVELAKNDYELRKKYNIINIEIIKEYTPDLPPILCVAMEIEQVVINLVKNAAQAMGDQAEPKAKPRIIMRTLQHGDKLRVEIEDNGPGMDETVRRHIFDPFYTTKDIGVGTGLGLSVAYTIIVTKHGGQLSVKSRPGQGATFTIDLPISRDRS